MAMIEICGMLIHTRPEHSNAVAVTLAKMPGAEVHEITDNGRIVITIEQLPDAPRLSESLAAVHNVDGVLAASLVYEHSEPDPDDPGDRPVQLDRPDPTGQASDQPEPQPAS